MSTFAPFCSTQEEGEGQHQGAERGNERLWGQWPEGWTCLAGQGWRPGQRQSADFHFHFNIENISMLFFWHCRCKSQVRLKDNAELALALKETKGAGLTVTANAFLVYWSDIDNVIEMSAWLFSVTLHGERHSTAFHRIAYIYECCTLWMWSNNIQILSTLVMYVSNLWIALISMQCGILL